MTSHPKQQIGDYADFWLWWNDKITSFAKQPCPQSNFEKRTFLLYWTNVMDARWFAE